MLFFPKLNDRNCGKILTVMPVHNCDDGKCGNNNAINHPKVQGRLSGKPFSVFCRVLSLLIALAIAPPVLLAQEWDNDHHEDRKGDRNGIVGSWIGEESPNLPDSVPFKFLATFTEDGGIIASFFGGSENYHGLWKKVAPRTFAVKFLSIRPPNLAPGFEQPEITVTITSDALMLNLQGDELRGMVNVVFTPAAGQLSSFDAAVVFTLIKF